MKKIILLFILTISFFTLNAQNSCANPQVIAEGVYTIAQIDGTDPAFPNCNNNTAASMAEWYTYTPSEDHSLIITTDLPQNFPPANGVDTRFHVYTGTCGSLTCYANSDDDGAGLTSYAQFNVYMGTTYYIAFDNKWTASGFDFQLIKNPIIDTAISFTSQSISDLGHPYCLVDMNGDFLDDVVTANSTEINIHTQSVSGGFNTVTIAAPVTHQATWSMAAADFDGNGYSDLLYGNGQRVTIMKASNDGTSFTAIPYPEYVFSQRTNFVDINSDGHLDAFVCHDVEPNVYYINDGSGNLIYHKTDETDGLDLGSYVTGGNYGSIWVDYNNDHNIDMFIAKCGGSGDRPKNQLFENNGDGTYTEISISAGLYDNIQTWSSAWADFDFDGDMDVLVGASTGSNKLMQNNGDGTFTDITAGSGWDTFSHTSYEYLAHDFNNDGYIDVFASGYMVLNNGDGTFTNTNVQLGQGAVGDVNNDGFLDVFNGDLEINDGNGNNWVKINTVGTDSNLQGIGARVELTSTLGTQIRDVKSGDGFKHMSSLTTHFGLGSDDIIDNITIYWPSGNIDSWDDQSINSALTLVENSAPLRIHQELINDLTIYPNPVANKLTLATKQDLTNSLISVFDIKGKRVLNSRYKNNEINVTTLNTGTYFLRIIKDGKVAKLKFIKQ